MKKYLLSLIAVTPFFLQSEKIPTKTTLILNSDFFEEYLEEDAQEELLLSIEDLTAPVDVENDASEELLLSTEDLTAPVDLNESAAKENPIEPLAAIDNPPNKDPQEQSELVVEENCYKKTETRSMQPQTSAMTEQCTPDIQPYQINLGHIEGRGVGYNTGYTTLEGFLAPSMGKYIPFFDVKGHVLDDGKLATNIGLGVRYIINPIKYLVGVNGYYDYRQTKHGHYNQLGAGLEGFFDRWEFRANGYLPIGNKKFGYDKELTGVTFKKFQGNNIYLNEIYNEKIEFSMKGFNAEVGVHPLKPMRAYDLFVGAGTYYYVGNFGKNTWGGKLRVSGRVTKYVSLELSDSFDRVFHNRFQGQITLSYPLGSKKLRPQKQSNPNTCYSDNIMYARGSQPVTRQDMVVVNHQKNHQFIIDPIAVDPTTGQPYFVVFVNNTNTSPDFGNGTFENPFQNLAPLDNATNAQTASAPGNTVYIFSGDGTSTHMANGFVMQSQQRLLGSGTAQIFQTTKGTLIIPAQTAGLPHITFVSGNNGVTMDNACTVSGLHISFPGTMASTNHSCIVGSSSIGGVSGGGTITNNVLLNETIGINLGYNSPTGGSEGDFLIDNNICNFHGAPNSSFQGFGMIATFTNGHAIISNNIFSENLVLNAGNSVGLLFRANSGTSPTQVDVLNNEASYNSLVGFRMITGGTAASPVCVTVIGNRANNNNDLAFQVDSETPTPTVHAIIENNTAITTASSTGTLVNAFDIRASGGSSLCARINNNTAILDEADQALGGVGYVIGPFAAANRVSLEPMVGNVGTVSFPHPPIIIPVFPNDCNCQ